MARRKTDEEFIKEVYELVGDEYEFLEGYINNKTPISCRHNICGHMWSVRPNSFLIGSRCPKCALDKISEQRKITFEDVKEFIKNNSECRLISKRKDYTDTLSQITLLCHCSNTFKTDYNQFKNMNKRQCNECGFRRSADSKRLSYKEVKNFIEVESDSGCRLLSEEYVSAHSKLNILCKCKKEFKTSYQEFRSSNKRQCNHCGYENISESLKLSYEDVKKFIEDNESGCKLLSKTYKNSSEKLKLRCRCGKVFHVSFNHIKSNNKKQCNECSYVDMSSIMSITHNDFIRRLRQETNNEYSTSETYSGMMNRLLFTHNKCGYSWRTTPNSILNGGSGCPICSKKTGGRKRAKTTNTFKREMVSIYGNEYTLMSEYVVSHMPVTIKHVSCGEVYNVIPSVLLRKTHGCPFCSLPSRAEIKILNHLKNLKVKHKKEFRIDECRNIHPLPFDFAILNQSGASIMALVEYDGEHHYESINFGGISDDEALINHQKTKHNDNIKNQYCKDNNIPLLRIPYWDFDNIEEILEEWLREHEVLQNDKNIA